MPSTYTNLLYHLIFSTKGRRPLITDDLKEELYRYIGGIIRSEDGIQLEIGGISDHVHILAKLKPAISISQMLNRIKTNSSKWVNENRKSDVRFAWQEGYAAFSVSESQVEHVRQYIRTQEQHHRKQSFQDELVALLQNHFQGLAALTTRHGPSGAGTIDAYEVIRKTQPFSFRQQQSPLGCSLTAAG